MRKLCFSSCLGGGKREMCTSAIENKINGHTSMEVLIGEATAYEKKEMEERRKPKSWLRTVSSFANGGAGMLAFGISDNDEVVGLVNPDIQTFGYSS